MNIADYYMMRYMRLIGTLTTLFSAQEAILQAVEKMCFDGPMCSS